MNEENIPNTQRCIADLMPDTQRRIDDLIDVVTQIGLDNYAISVIKMQATLIAITALDEVRQRQTEDFYKVSRSFK